MERCSDWCLPRWKGRLRLPANDWRPVGVDDFRLRALSRIQIRVRRIQRQVVCRPEGSARRLVRDATQAYSLDLSKLFLSARALDGRRLSLREGCVNS